MTSQGPEGLPLIAPVGKVDAPHSPAGQLEASGVREPAAPTERDRLNHDFDSAIRMIGEFDEQNRSMVLRDYASETRIASDLKLDKDDPQNPQKIQEEKTVRLAKQKAARVTESGLSDEDLLLEIKKQMVAGKGEWSGKPLYSSGFDNAAQAEIARRKALINAFDVLYTAKDCKDAAAAEIVRRKTDKLAEIKNVAIKKRLEELNIEKRSKSDNELTELPADEAIKVDSVTLGAADEAEINADVTKKYYGSESGVYYKVTVKRDEKGNITSSKVETDQNGIPIKNALSDTYEPLYNETIRISGLTEDGQPDGIPTQQALEAKKLLTTFQLIPDPDDQHRKVFRLFTQKEISRKEIREAEEAVIPGAYHLIDAVLEPFGKKLEHEDEVKDSKKTGKKRLVVPKEITDIDPTCKTGEFGELGGRLSRLSILLNQYEDVDTSRPEARALLAANIYDEISLINISRITSSRYPNLADELKGLKKPGEILQQNRHELVLNVKRIIHKYHAKRTPNPEEIPLNEANLFRILLTAYVCEGRVGINPATGEREVEKALQAALLKEKVAGGIDNSDIEAIIALAGTQTAHVILEENLGFDLKRLKERKITDYADRVIEGIDKKRPDDKKMTPEEKKGYRAFFEEMQTLGEEKVEESGLGGWIKAFGIIALILGPGFFELFKEGSGGTKEEQPQT